MVEHISLIDQFNDDVAANLIVLTVGFLWALLVALIFMYKAKAAFPGRRAAVIRDFVIMQKAMKQETKNAKKKKNDRAKEKRLWKMLEQQTPPPYLQNGQLTSSTNFAAVPEGHPMLQTVMTTRSDDVATVPGTEDGKFNQKTVPTNANWN